MTLPVAPLYLASLEVIPWKKTIDKVADAVSRVAAPDARLLDLMCGPGQLLGLLSVCRPDLELTGLDLDKGYTNYASTHVPSAKFVTTDVREFIREVPSKLNEFDIITITSGLHHLDPIAQLTLISSICQNFLPHAKLIIGEICIAHGMKRGRDFLSEALHYHYNVLNYITKVSGDQLLFAEAIDVFRADIVGEEYKFGQSELMKMLEPLFSEVRVERIWPDEKTEISDESGEFVFICSNSKLT